MKHKNILPAAIFLIALIAFAAATPADAGDRTALARLDAALAAAKADFTQGFIDTAGTLRFTLSPDSFSQGEDFSEGRAGVQIGEKRGFIDRNGRVAVLPRFDLTFAFQNGLAQVRVDSLFGVIDTNGRYIVEPKYGSCEQLSSCCIVISEKGKFGWVDQTGALIQPPRYDQAEILSEDMALIRLGNRSGIMDTTGRIVVEPKFDSVFYFHYGWARIKDQGRCGLVSHDGRVIPPRYDDCAAWFSEGRAWVRIGKKFGFIDTTGRLIVDCRFDEAADFSGGRAAVRTGDRWGYIDAAGRVRVEPRYENAEPFTRGMAVVTTAGKCGLIDTSGRLILEPQYDRISNWFFEGRAYLSRDGKYGLIDTSGRIVLEPQYDGIYGFTNGYALIQQGGAWGFIDGSYRAAVEPLFEDASNFLGGRARVKLDSLYGFIDTTGAMVIKNQFTYADEDLSKGRARVSVDGKYGLIDRSGAYLVKPSYDGMSDFYDGLARVKIGDPEPVADSLDEILADLARAPRLLRAEALKRLLAAFEEGKIFNCLGWQTDNFLDNAVTAGDEATGQKILAIIRAYPRIRTRVYQNNIGTLDYCYYYFGRAIRKIYGRKSLPMLLTCAEDKNLSLAARANLCLVAAEMHDKNTYARIAELVKDVPPENLIQILGATGDEWALPYILPYEPTDPLAVAENLKNIPAAASRQALVRILRAELASGQPCRAGMLGSTALGMSILSLGVIGDETVIPALAEALADTQSETRRLAAWSLWILGDKRGLAVMVRDGNLNDLQIMADPASVAYLAPLLHKDRDEETREDAIDALTAVGNPDAAQILFERLDDPAENQNIRYRAAISLARLGESRAVPVVLEILRDESWEQLWDQCLQALLYTAPDTNLRSILREYEGYVDEVMANANRAMLGDPKAQKWLSDSLAAVVLGYQWPVFTRLRKYLSIKSARWLELLAEAQGNRTREGILLGLMRSYIPYQDLPAVEAKLRTMGLPDRAATQAHLALAAISQDARDYERERVLAGKAFELVSGEGDNNLILEARWLLADAQAYLGDTGAARKNLAAALECCGDLTADERAEAIERFPDAYTHCLLAELDLRTKDFKGALREFNAAASELNYRVSIWLSEFMRQREPRERLAARIAIGMGKAHGELQKEYLDQGIAGYKSAEPVNNREREIRDSGYYERIRRYVADGDYEKAQALTEELILLKLNEDFENMNVEPVNPGQKKELDELRRRKKEIDELKRWGEAKPAAGSAPDTIQQKKQREFKKYLNTLKSQNPKLFAIVNSEPSNLKALQDLGVIPDNMCVLQYLAGDDELYIFIVKNNDLVIRTSAVGREKIAGLIDEYRAQMKNLGPKAETEEYEAELYRLLVEPLESDLKGIDVVGVIPNQQLYYLPFGALRKKDSPKYLGEQYQIFYMNSTSMLDIIARQEGCDIADAPLVAYANADGSLPEAETEVREIARFYPENDILVEAGCLKDSVFRSTGCRIVQFATHGMSLPYAPTTSYLVLAPKGEAGRLKVEEIWGLDFKDCPLVVLSACETAEGKLMAGDEVVSLAFGFIYAGSASCVATLWEVASQSTAELMQEFHQNLKKGLGRVRSLQAAQESLMKKYPEPFYWAPFVLIGDWR